MTLVQQQVVVDPALSNVSIKYTNSQFIADILLPTLPVKLQTGKYFIYDKSNLRIDKTNRAAGSPSNQVEFSMSFSGVFACDDHALKGFVADEVQDQAEAIVDPLVDETENITEKLMLDREATAALLLQDTANLTQNITLSGTSRWDDYNNSDPVGDIRPARTIIHQNTFKKANVIAMSKLVFEMLAEHPVFIERIKFSQLGVVTEELMARVLKVDKIVIGEAGYNAANEGQADSLAYVWGKHCIVAYVAPSVGPKTLTLGLTFTYKKRTVKRWRDEDAEGTYVRVGSDNYVQKIVAAPCGYLLKTVIS